uniref:Pentatricopeptide repeat-containing protein At4g04790, mitochondrial n=1 Tax=Anthurium amnicola TaxID=1678845 RepID=A0A1D1YUV6_9ARAE
MRARKLMELAASALGKAISSSSNSAGNVLESSLSVILSTLKKRSPSSSKHKPEVRRVAKPIATRKKPVVPASGSSRPTNGTRLRAARKPSKSPAQFLQELLVLKEAGSEEVGEATAGGDKSVIDVVSLITSTLQGETGSLEESQSEETNCRGLTENSSSEAHNIFQLYMRKEKSRERKARWTSKNTQDLRISRLIKRSAETLGTESTLEVLSKLGQETGIKEYNALIGLCIDKARQSTDDEDSFTHLQKAFQLFRSMKEDGFQIEEESYGPLLMYLIEMEMIEEFKNISEMIKGENPESSSRMSYYEMLLWIRVGDDEKIQDVCSSLRVDDSEDSISIAANYILAFCESQREKEILNLLEVLDIRRTPPKYASKIFKSMGKLSLENFAKKFILALQSTDSGREGISSLIFDYISSIPNLAVEEVVSEFRCWHEKFKVAPSSHSYDKLINFCCNSFKVYATLDPILRGTEQICEQYWVHELCSMMRRHSLKLGTESSKSLMSLYVMTKDFEGAYNLLAELKEMNMKVDTGIYNALMIGYFREKNIDGGLRVLKQMKNANVKPDSETFSYLIHNCGCEEDIVKCLEEMKHFQVDFTKQIYIALVNAYANCGKFDQAKQVILDKCIPVEFRSDIKNALVFSFSLNGNILDALEIYDAMKRDRCRVEPKTILSLIDFFPSDGQINRLLQLLAGLDSSVFWFDACGRVAVYCVRNNLLSSAVDLLKQLKAEDESGTCTVIDQMFCQIWETNPTNMQIGMALLEAVKDDLGLQPSRTSLDFLLSACAKKKDLKSARSIWVEYSKAGLPFNILTYLRMYHAFLASGDFKGAKKLLKKIPQMDRHVCNIVKACNEAYGKPLLPSGE